MTPEREELVKGLCDSCGVEESRFFVEKLCCGCWNDIDALRCHITTLHERVLAAENLRSRFVIADLIGARFCGPRTGWSRYSEPIGFVSKEVAQRYINEMLGGDDDGALRVVEE